MNEIKYRSMPAWPLIVLFYTSVDTILFGTNSNTAFLYVPRILGLLGIVSLPLLYTGSLHRICIHKRDFIVAFIMILIILVSSIVNSDLVVTTISRLIVVILAYVICHTYSKEQFAAIFDTFIYAVSIVAIIVELVSYTLPGLIMRLPVVVNTVNHAFYTCFFGSLETTEIDHVFIRGNGIFWEPGAFAIYLIFALIIQLFVLKKTNIKRIGVFLFALAITFSTTGYLALAVLLLAYVISNRTDSMSRRIKVLFIVIAGLIIVGCLFIDTSLIYNSVFSKLTSGTSGATTRYSSFYNGMRVALDHPIIGVATNTSKYMAEYVFASGSIFYNGGTSITNTFVGQFASYGLIFGSMFMYGTFMYLKKYSNSFLEWMLLSMTIFMSYFGEKFFSFFPFVFVFYGLSHKRYSTNENSCD